MDALDLIQLGRQLTKLGEAAVRGGPAPGLPAGPALVLRDVFAHPGAAIKDIAERTALPQSYVSESVARLAAQGMPATEPDPGDRRRTRVRVAEAHVRTVAGKITAAVAAALGAAGTPDVLAALELLAARLLPRTPGPIVARLRDA